MKTPGVYNIKMTKKQTSVIESVDQTVLFLSGQIPVVWFLFNTND